MPDLDDDEAPQSDHEWARMRKESAAAKREADELRAKLAAAERKSLMGEAGVDLTDPRSKYFLKGYEGPDDAESIKSEWQRFAGGAPAAPVVDTHAQEAAAAMTRMQQAADGGSVTPVPSTDAARAKLFADIATATAGITDSFMKQQMAEQMMRNSGIVDFGTQ